MITEDDMFENLDLSEQFAVRRKLIGKYLSLDADDRWDTNMIRRWFDCTWMLFQEHIARYFLHTG